MGKIRAREFPRIDFNVKKKVLITSALPYANGQLHFGHIAGAYLPADCYARFERLQGSEVLYICGSDEYGVAITLAAELAGKKPQEHIDFFHKLNSDLFKQLHFSFDHFSRTTWEGHEATVQQFFNDLLANGYIKEEETEQLFSLKENRFLADRYVVGICPKCGYSNARGDECPRCGASYEATDLKEPRSKLTGGELIRRSTKHWFLRFDLFKDRLKSFLEERDWKSNVKHFASSYLEHIRPRSITRDGEWGVPLPGSEGKVFYVWFDAPIGYITATQEWALSKGNPEAWKDFWLDPTTTYVQFIGKDNIPFHALFFPAMIMGQNRPYKLVDHLPANEFLLLQGRQFSKSEGWTIDLVDFFRYSTADQIRYTLAANAPERQDAEFSWKDFENRCNSELLGKYGNLANRVLVFVHRHSAALIPKKGILGSQDREFLDHIFHLSEEIRISYQHFHLRKATTLLMEMAQLCNGYFDGKKPWILVKKGGPEIETALFCSMEAIKFLALVSSPIIPDAAQKIWEWIGYTTLLEKENWDKVVTTTLVSGRSLPPHGILFKPIERSWIEEKEEELKSLKLVNDARN